MSQQATVIETLPGRSVWIEYTASVDHVCPVDGTADVDRVTIRYQGALCILEADSLERYLDTFGPMAVTLEELVGMIRDDLLVVGVDAEVEGHGDHGERGHIVASTHPFR